MASEGDVPERLGRYEVSKRIGEGGLGAVHLATFLDGAIERTVALRIVDPELSRDAPFVARVIEEAGKLARLKHPNVVEILDSGSARGRAWVATQYVEGASVGDLMDAVGRAKIPMPRGIALRIVLDALAGLHAAHELADANGGTLSLVHRRISPSKLLVGRDGVTRVSDFLSATLGVRRAPLERGAERGAYLAPEMIDDESGVDRRADVFLAGAVLWELLTDHVLFTGTSDADLRSAVKEAAIPRPSTLAEGLPAAVEAVVMKALATKRDARFASAKAFASALQAAGGATIAAPSSVGRFVRDVGPELPERGGARPAPKRAQSSVQAVVLLAPGRPGARKFTGSRAAFRGARGEENEPAAPPREELRADAKAASTGAPAEPTEASGPKASKPAVGRVAPPPAPKRAPVFAGAAADEKRVATAAAGPDVAGEPTVDEASRGESTDASTKPTSTAADERAAEPGAPALGEAPTADASPNAASPLVAVSAPEAPRSEGSLDAPVEESAEGALADESAEVATHTDTHTALAMSTFSPRGESADVTLDGHDGDVLDRARRSRVQRIAFATFGAAAVIGLVAWGVSALRSDPTSTSRPPATSADRAPDVTPTTRAASTSTPAPPDQAAVANDTAAPTGERTPPAPTTSDAPPAATVAQVPWQRPAGHWSPPKKPPVGKKKPPKYIP